MPSLPQRDRLSLVRAARIDGPSEEDGAFSIVFWLDSGGIPLDGTAPAVRSIAVFLTEEAKAPGFASPFGWVPAIYPWPFSTRASAVAEAERLASSWGLAAP